MASGDDSSWGIGHLTSMPITLSFGVVLLAVLVLLIILRVVFGSVSVGVR